MRAVSFWVGFLGLGHRGISDEKIERRTLSTENALNLRIVLFNFLPIHGLVDTYDVLRLIYSVEAFVFWYQI